MKGNRKVEFIPSVKLAERIEKEQSLNIWKMVDCTPCAWETNYKYSEYAPYELHKTSKGVIEYLVTFEQR